VRALGLAPDEEGSLKPAPFDYHAPGSVADAVGLLAEHADDVKALAGGQSLVPMLALRLTRFGHLVDLTRIPELRGVDRVDGSVRIGATTVQADLEHDAEIAVSAPLIARAVPHIGHFQIRNRGTIGGSLAHADPASELPAVALALDATFIASSTRGSRTIPATDFFVGTWQTALADDELLVATSFPVWTGFCGFAVREFARRPGDFAIAGAAGAVEVDSLGRVSRAALGLFGVGDTPIRVPAAESALVGRVADAAATAEIAQIAARDLDPIDDVHAPGWYRKRIAAFLVESALRDAIDEAEEAGRVGA
jgi:carbon-monoxide dehydrogenase medium subunit